MRLQIIRATTIVLALVGAVAASAQDAPRDTGARGALPGPNANPPGSAALAPDGSNPVQPVPGAMPGSDTVPSTISAKNAEDDKLITTAYTFKSLTDEQRRMIYEVLKDKPPGSAFNADIGSELPPVIELQPLPDEVTSKLPQTRGYAYAVAEHRVLLVAPVYRVVVAVIAEAPGSTTGGGARSAQP
ncbi:MAG: hypothetical protein QOI12_3438 [Alphaproteobacteria bacterium]|jgi:hypothetical protein|nr:hypothetical protein [Alphaproteobacteria bacterium]